MSAARLDVEVAVVGAGIVGLASAAALARCGRSVIILERNRGIARETTSRNSEVVHAGIYYPAGSLKSELCRTGREALYRRCEQHGIPHRRLGKLIVATSVEEIAVLERIQATARSNQVPLELLEAAQVERLEPDVRALAALLSPESGIVDAQSYALSFLAEAESEGAVLALGTDVEALECGSRGWRLRARSSAPGAAAGELQSLECAGVVNAAGLASDRIALLAGLDVDTCGYRLHFCKGDYFSLAPGAPLSLSRLVYPVPAGAGLGIHATLDLAGRIRFGPDAEFVPAPRFDVDPAKAGVFADAVSRYLPAVASKWLAPDYAGVRPRLAGSGEPFADFVVREESDRGLPGLVNCIGIESPGLTAASAIADRVVELLS